MRHFRVLASSDDQGKRFLTFCRGEAAVGSFVASVLGELGRGMAVEVKVQPISEADFISATRPGE